MSKKQKNAKKFASWYANELAKSHKKDKDETFKVFYTKYLELVNSPEYEFYKNHHIPVDNTYFFVTASLVSRDLRFTYDETMELIYNIAWPIRKRFRKIVNFIDRFPHGYKFIVWFLDKMNRSYGDDLTWDFVKKEKDKYEYQFSKCIYVDMFEHYGIRNYCKVLCNSDIHVLGGACKHLKFIRYSDLSDSLACHDALVKVKK